ncbi:beta-tubulin, partial [Leishmania donovani]
MREIVTCQA